MARFCPEEKKKRGNFIKAKHTNSGGGGMWGKELTEEDAYKLANEMRGKGYKFGELDTPEKYNCWWGNPAFQHITIEYELICCPIELTYKINGASENSTVSHLELNDGILITADMDVEWEIIFPDGKIVKHENQSKISIKADQVGTIQIKGKNNHCESQLEFTVSAPKIKLTSETVATLPANRSRTTIGVGEAVTIKSNIPVKWTVDSQLANQTGATDTGIIITAGAKAGSITVKAKTDHDEQSMTFTIVEPQDVEYKLIRVQHQKDDVSIGMYVSLNILPNSVNFNAVQIAELEATAIGTGYWKGGTGKKHCSHKGVNIEVGHPCDWYPIIHDGKANMVYHDGKIVEDAIGVDESDPGCPLGDGSLETEIEIQWKLNGSQPKKLTDVIQKITIDKKGVTIASKGNVSVSRSCNDPNEN